MRSTLVALVMLLAGAGPVDADPPANKKIVNLTFAVSKVDPAIGDADGGTYVRLEGVGFTRQHGTLLEGAKVYFGSRRGELVRVVSDTEVIVQAPGGKVEASPVDVLLVTKSSGEAKLAKAFTFVVKKQP